ncbi:YHYH protein [Chitinophagales bacterium]|nr:YHYH protein [Chitinophagales bacterium]
MKKKIASILITVFLLGCSKDDGSVAEQPISEETPNLTHLPFGGVEPTSILVRNQGEPSPDFLSLWLCGIPSDGAGAADASDWTNSDGTWDYTKKPQVEGEVIWNHHFDISLDNLGNRNITGNNLPNHPTGVFPIQQGSEAWDYDKNPNIISEQIVDYTLPAKPEVASEPNCVFFGPAGFSVTGAAIYHGASTLGTDAAAHEMLDRFGGHTDGTERYHYHFPAQDLQDHIHLHEQGHSALMGYMLDGFAIYGPYGENGELLSSADLDECHGHTHSVLWDGQMIDLYHYHWTYDFPYNIGCFKGTPH